MCDQVSASEATRRTGLPYRESSDLSTATTVPAPGTLSLPTLAVCDRGVF